MYYTTSESLNHYLSERDRVQELLNECEEDKFDAYMNMLEGFNSLIRGELKLHKKMQN